VRIETEEAITAEEYATMLQFKSPKHRVIRKKRTCFMYNAQYFEVDTFESPEDIGQLLEIELTSENDAVTIPDFIQVIDDVTDSKSYYNSSLAKIPA
jgi:CYTH domain-containing protein